MFRAIYTLIPLSSPGVLTPLPVLTDLSLLGVPLVAEDSCFPSLPPRLSLDSKWEEPSGFNPEMKLVGANRP